MDGTEALPSALATATDEEIVGAIVQLGDDRLSLISRQLSRHAAAAQAKRSSATRKARLFDEITALLATAPDGICRHELSRRLRRPAADLDDALTSLQMIRVVRVQAQRSRGRTAQRYSLA
jgi:hypothetical protein